MDELIAAIYEEFADLKPGIIKEDTSLMELLGWSSLNLVIIRAKIQDNFGVKLSDQQIKSCITVDDLNKLISSKRQW